MNKPARIMQPTTVARAVDDLSQAEHVLFQRLEAIDEWGCQPVQMCDVIVELPAEIERVLPPAAGSEVQTLEHGGQRAHVRVVHLPAAS